ncbi:hypothetical protein J6590_009169 [Homalodisca vitripennis]|nr:hypothetical protein J6590_009169 [Homalodisca vitripennis]
MRRERSSRWSAGSQCQSMVVSDEVSRRRVLCVEQWRALAGAAVVSWPEPSRLETLSFPLSCFLFPISHYPECFHLGRVTALFDRFL